MGKKYCIYAVIIFCLLAFLQGCETTPDAENISTKMSTCLNSCLGKLTQDKLIMQASTPTEKVPVEDGEIWIYKYRRSEIKTTGEGTGSVLFPVEVESKSNDYALDVRLRFDKKGILKDWSYSGHYASFNHPFADLRCE